MLGLGLGLSRSGFVAESLLLDTYSGAAAAYSLRKLSSTYTSSAIRVRESATNTEADIGFNADGSLDTTSLLAHTGANDGFVTTWYDQSGNSNDATQATASAQPKIVSAGVLVTENGKPSVSFDGVDDDLIMSSDITTNTHYVSMVAANTTKGRILGDLTFGYFLESGATNNRYYINFNLYNLGTRIFQNQEIVSWSRINTSSIFYQNTSEINNQTVVADNYKFKVLFSSSNSLFSDGNLQEIVIYPTDQSTNRSGIEANINDHYNIY